MIKKLRKNCIVKQMNNIVKIIYSLENCQCKLNNLRSMFYSRDGVYYGPRRSDSHSSNL